MLDFKTRTPLLFTGEQNKGIMQRNKEELMREPKVEL